MANSITAEQFKAAWVQLDAIYVQILNSPTSGAGGAVLSGVGYDTNTDPFTLESSIDAVAALGAPFEDLAAVLSDAGAVRGDAALAVNLAFMELGNAYVAYLGEGHPAILDIAKLRPNGPGQSFHDNILGNVTDGPTNARFPATYGDGYELTEDVIVDFNSGVRTEAAEAFGTRPIYSGTGTVGDNALLGKTMAFDLAAGLSTAQIDLDGRQGDIVGDRFFVVTTSGVVTGYPDEASARAAAAASADSTFVNTEDALVTTIQTDATGTAGNDWFVAEAGNQTIEGGEGSDTYSVAENNDGGAFVDLTSGIAFGGAETGFDNLQSIENVAGGDGNDVVYGNSGDNVFFASAGEDQIDGRGGNDAFNASSATGDVEINLSAGTATGAGIDTTLVSVERAIGGQGNDTLVGTVGDNILVGGAGNDTIETLGGNDIVQGGEGTDKLVLDVASGDATIAFVNGAWTVTTGEGEAAQTVILTGIEEVQFNDATSTWLVGGGSELGLAGAVASADVNGGDTVLLADGTFNLGGAQVVIDRDVTIKGQGKSDTTLHIDYNTTNSGDARGAIFVADGVNATISDLAVNGTGQLVSQAIRVVGNATIDNVAVYDVYYAQYVGTGVAVQFGHADISNSDFYNIQRIGAHFRDDTTGSVSHSTFTGKGDGAHLDYGIEAGAGGQITVDHVTITGNTGGAGDGSGSAGILATTYYGDGTSVVITNSNITGNGSAVAVGYDENDTSYAEFGEGNTLEDGVSIIGNGTYVGVDALNTPVDWQGGAQPNVIEGGLVDDDLAGGEGSDTFVDSPGVDDYDGEGGIDTVQFGADAGELRIVDGQWVIWKDGEVADTLTGIERVEIGSDVYLLVDQLADGGFTSVQAAIDAAAGGETILVAAGENPYVESADFTASPTAEHAQGLPGTNAGNNPLGLLINKSVTLQGVDSAGNLVNAASEDAPVIQSERQSGWGTHFFVTADDVTINGLTLEATPTAWNGSPLSVINKVVEVVGDNFVLTGSTVGAPGEVDVASSVYVNDRSVPVGTGSNWVSQIQTLTIDGNIVEGSVVVANGVGLNGANAPSELILVVNNQFVNNNADPAYRGGIIITGNDDQVAWRNAEVAMPVVEGNTFNDPNQSYLYARSDDLNFMPDRAFVDDFIADNTIETYAFVTNDGDSLQYHDAQTDLGGGNIAHSNGFTLHKDVGSASADAEEGNAVLVSKSADEAGTQTIVTDGLIVKELNADTDLTLELGNGVTSIELADYAEGLGANVNVTGNDENNDITGNSGDNILNGGGGNDTLYGGEGADTIDGGTGNDVLDGGAGADSLDGGEGDDTLYGELADTSLAGGEGTDLLVFADGTDPADVMAKADDITDVELIRIGDTPGSSTYVVLNGMSIQAAIDGAASGDTIVIGAGTFEEVLSVTKDLAFLGANSGLAGTDGSRGGETVISGSISFGTGSDNSTLDGVRIEDGAATVGRLIYVDADGITITNSVLDGDYPATDGSTRGIITTGNADNLTVTDNKIVELRSGIYFNDGPGAIVTGNTFVGNGNAINIDDPALSDVSGNDFQSSAGAHIAVAVNAANVDLSTFISDTNTFDTADKNVSIYAANSDQEVTGTELVDKFFGDLSASNNAEHTFYGLGGDDVIYGGGGNDTLYGGEGADTMDGGTGNDVLDGGEGVDTYVGGDGVDTVKLGFNRENVDLSDLVSSGEITSDDGVETVSGVEILEFADSASEGRVLIVGANGFATLQDAIDAATGLDTILLSEGAFGGGVIGASKAGLTIIGIRAEDDAAGRTGSESVIDGNLLVQAEGVRIEGVKFSKDGAGAALTAAATGLVVVNSLFVQDAVAYSGIGIETNIGGAGSGLDVSGSAFHGWATGIYVNGGENIAVGDNLFDGNNVGVSVDAYPGSSNISVSGNAFANSGFEHVGVGLFDAVVDAGSIVGPNTFDASVREVGLYGLNSGGQSISGTEHSDGVFAGSGNDTFIYEIGQGSDTFDGGAGSDTLKIDASSVAGDGTVTIGSSSLSVGSLTVNYNSVERFDITLGAGNHEVDASGSAFDQLTLNMGGGDDIYRAAAGLGHTLNGGDGENDLVDYSGLSNGLNIILNGTVSGSGVSHTLSGFENVRGSTGNDSIVGTTGNNVFLASNGTDFISAGGGLDTFDASSASAAVIAFLNEGSAWGSASWGSNSTSLRHVENLKGSDFDDVLEGNSSANELHGGLGNDRLAGYGGDDFIFGGDGIDTAVFDGGIGSYRIDTATKTIIGSDGTTVLDGVENLEFNGFAFDWDYKVGIGDFDGDGTQDQLIKNPNGWHYVTDGDALVGVGFQSVAAVGDFNGDGKDDVLTYSSSGWLGYIKPGVGGVGLRSLPNHEILAVGDLDGDGKDDILMMNKGNGYLSAQVNGGTTYMGLGGINGREVIGLADLNGDNSQDVIFKSASGWVAAYDLANNSYTNIGFQIGRDLVGVGDFNGDGNDDLLFQTVDSSNGGTIGYTSYLSGGGANVGVGMLGAGAVLAVGNYDGDATDDIFLLNGDDSISVLPSGLVSQQQAVTDLMLDEVLDFGNGTRVDDDMFIA